MKRRDFLAASAALPLLGSTSAFAAKKPQQKPLSRLNAKKPGSSGDNPPATTETRNVISLPEDPPAQWRTFDIQSDIVLKRVRGKARLWLPLAQYKDTLWQRSLGHTWQGNFTNAGIYRDPVAEMEVFFADWAESTEAPRLQIVSQIALQDRHFDITRRGAIAERTEVLRRCLQPTGRVPIDGIIRQSAERAIGRIKDPLAMGKAIYDWVIERSNFDSTGKGIGNASIASLLEGGNLEGRSSDIALLFVGLCRSIGIPSRPVFGLRMGTSRLFGSLGILGDLSEAQHCRAEFYIPGYGWIGVDPADVRKAIREENLSNNDPRLSVLKKLLFGFWEMNWVSFNAAQDVELRGSNAPTLPFLLYPVVETTDGRYDSQETSRMSYNINATRVET